MITFSDFFAKRHINRGRDFISVSVSLFPVAAHGSRNHFDTSGTPGSWMLEWEAAVNTPLCTFPTEEPSVPYSISTQEVWLHEYGAKLLLNTKWTDLSIIHRWSLLRDKSRGKSSRNGEKTSGTMYQYKRSKTRLASTLIVVNPTARVIHNGARSTFFRISLQYPIL